MGKPSTQLSRRSSTLSMNDPSSKSNMNVPPMTSQKSARAKQKRMRKTEGTIKKLFSQLRRDSKSRLNCSNISSPSETSVIEIDDSLNNTVLLVTDLTGDAINASRTGNVTERVKSGNVTQRARKGNQPEYRRSKAKPIIIDDEPGVSTPQKYKFPIHHSTPIKQKRSIDDLILDVNNQLMDDSNNNGTKNINASSFLTIDLTTESTINKSAQQTIIDLDSTSNQDCVLTSVSQSSSMSGDSEVTVLRRPERTRSITRQIKTGLANLNAREKDKILQFISENLFNGCSTPSKIQPRARATAEDTYIKEVIVGKKLSRNSIGSNVYNPEKYVNTTGLRMIVIDGSNVAMAHGDGRYFSVRGLQIVIDYFLSRGHAVKAFVPRFRNKSGKSSQPQLLVHLERQGHVIFTPSREVLGYNISSYDDRYIIQCAAEFEGIIVSNDGFNDLKGENPRWADVINNRTLQFNWVGGMIMFPRDPLGRHGPTLENFLKMPPQNSSR